jgi:hypothetical protein
MEICKGNVRIVAAGTLKAIASPHSTFVRAGTKGARGALPRPELPPAPSSPLPYPVNLTASSTLGVGIFRGADVHQ